MFDWNLAIERNTGALTQIVAGLFELARAAGASSSTAPPVSPSTPPIPSCSGLTRASTHKQDNQPMGYMDGASNGLSLDSQVKPDYDDLGRDCASHPHPEPVEGRGCGEFSHKHHLNLTSILRAAEAALRRLIMLYVIVKGIKAGVYAKRDDRPLPDFASFKRAENPLPKFNLTDPRPSLMVTWVDENETADADPFLILSLSKDEEVYEEQTLRQAQGEDSENTEDSVTTANFLARLQALDHALNNLPREARRMAREIQKRNHLRSLPLTEDKPLRGSWADPPIRIGKPPGHRDRGDHEVDDILKECHGLFRDIQSSPP